MRIDWTVPALSDLKDHYDFVAAQNAAAASGQIDLVFAAVKRLVEYPKIGRPGDIAGTRELVIGGTPYVAIYRVRSEACEILRVMHGAQQRPPRPRRRR